MMCFVSVIFFKSVKTKGGFELNYLHFSIISVQRYPLMMTAIKTFFPFKTL